MLPEIDRFLHEHQTDWKEMLPYGSATADIVQNLLSTHRLVLVEKELAAGLWVSGTTAGELPERGTWFKVWVENMSFEIRPGAPVPIHR